MPYSDFTIDAARTRFGLTLVETAGSVIAPTPITISAWLNETLAETLSIGVSVGTEKARSELIITPVLVEARRQVNRTVGIFSGVDFPVDTTLGLNGLCDFLISRGPGQLIYQAPILALVEAKRDDIRLGLGQCMATMVGAQIYNERHNKNISSIYGVVTTGSLWKFLSLAGTTLAVDPTEYAIADLAGVVGTLVAMLRTPAE